MLVVPVPEIWPRVGKHETVSGMPSTPRIAAAFAMGNTPVGNTAHLGAGTNETHGGGVRFFIYYGSRECYLT